MTVSSTSETTPKRTSAPTTNTRVSTGSLPSTDIVSDCHPGSSRASMTVSMTPPRSETTSCVASPITMRTCANPTGTAAKLRHPRTLSYSADPDVGTGGTISTRPRTRTHSGPP